MTLVSKIFSSASCLLLTYFLLASAYAADAPDNDMPSERTVAQSWFNPVISVTGGYALTRVGQAAAIFDPATITYYAFDVHNSDSKKERGTWGGLVGLALYNKPDREMQCGFSYYELQTKTVEGLLTQFSAGFPVEQVDYEYDFTGRQILFELKLLKLYGKYFHPYFEGAAGWSFNRTHHFESASLLSIADHRNSSFSYRVGLGMDIDLFTNLRLGAGYRFVDWGNAYLGEASMGGIGVELPLHQKHVYSNQFEAQLTYSI